MNKDDKVIQEFGEEWIDFNYSEMDKGKVFENYEQYFGIFPWELVSGTSVGFDMGCGSGRWAQFVAPKVQHLFCVEPSEAIEVAKKNLKQFDNVTFLRETTDTCSLEEGSQDFGYSLGVLHHIPDTEAALNDCSKLLKKGAPLLLYLYYNFENKPLWFRGIWRLSDLLRRVTSKLPKQLKKFVCNLIACGIYFPLSRSAYLLEKIGFDVSNIPLADYRLKPFYQCRNDALDRFGTRLEQRFSKLQITEMLDRAGFDDITFSPDTPFWCCVAIKR